MDAAPALDANLGEADASTPGDAGQLVDAPSGVDAAMPDAAVPDAGRRDAGAPTLDADFCERAGQLVMEAEHFRAQTGHVEVRRDDASEGIAMQVGDGGSLDFRVHLETGGTYYFWVRTLSDGPDIATPGDRTSTCTRARPFGSGSRCGRARDRARSRAP